MTTPLLAADNVLAQRLGAPSIGEFSEEEQSPIREDVRTILEAYTLSRADGRTDVAAREDAADALGVRLGPDPQWTSDVDAVVEAYLSAGGDPASLSID